MTFIPLRERAREYFQGLQDLICSGLGTFTEESWVHGGGGGGRTRVVEGGPIFEKAGVNFSAVQTILTEKLAERMQVRPQPVFATGISLVIHPASPMIPTVHMNLRYLEPADGGGWFGGGADLTPYYLFEEDAKHFHRTLKEACDSFDPGWYERFKRNCDEYFYIPHRKEARGVGGIFFDYERTDPERFFSFVQEVGGSFLDAYMPIVSKRQKDPWTPAEKRWQLLRRGRYAEFNLVYDRGTLFGLETGGRVESVLMSLPPEVRWEYHQRVEAGSREEKLLRILENPRAWV